MADKKISQLTGASTPVAGTEVLPIVQSGATVKVSIDNLTAGKSVSGASFVPTGSTVPANGMFLSSANSVGFASNSTEHWVVNASGNFNPVGSKGIGTNLAPVSEVVGTTFSTSAAAAGSNLTGSTLAADGTDTNIDINVTPKWSGSVNMTKVNIDGGTIDGTVIGGASAAAATVSSLDATGLTPKIANNGSADVTVQIGPDTPSAGRSGRIGFITSSAHKNWYIANNWLTAGALELVQTTTTGGSTMASSASFVLDSAGNAGIGATPESFFSTERVLKIGNGAYFGGRTNSVVEMNIYTNAYISTGGTPTYIGNGAACRYTHDSGKHLWYNAASGTAGGAISFTNTAALTTTGFGLGTSSPSVKLHLESSSSAVSQQYFVNTDVSVGGKTGGTYMYSRDPSNAWYSGIDSYVPSGAAGVDRTDLRFYTCAITSGERGRFTPGGDFLVGKTTTTAVVGTEISQDGYLRVGRSSSTTATTLDVYSTGAGAYRFYVEMSGTVFATNTTISAISDARLKENVRDLDVGLNAILALKPRKFDWKEGKGKNKKNDRGFIAQEFEQVFPDLIDTWKDPAPEGEEPYKSVRQDLIPVLVKAIQEQQTMIKSLEARIAALEAK
jgi:hypothetical protein